jgi:hypothetical protein
MVSGVKAGMPGSVFQLAMIGLLAFCYCNKALRRRRDSLTRAHHRATMYDITV